ncbi:hypothetical protein CTAYLR_003325 [Chrysophaeum taylorii]|uniref:Carboxypeptidase n=1 Tax=Chrysophaeum taylorii TaxID=2483200 RepID=A0AAD7UIM8_9STRA|nr:hypothetical protein CTAYLR_003325 [Chrysophaeum taylorii]
MWPWLCGRRILERQPQPVVIIVRTAPHREVEVVRGACCEAVECSPEQLGDTLSAQRGRCWVHVVGHRRGDVVESHLSLDHLQVDLLFVNASYSATPARSPYIGWTTTVRDEGAVAFAAAFYEASAMWPVPEAFERAKDAVGPHRLRDPFPNRWTKRRNLPVAGLSSVVTRHPRPRPPPKRLRMIVPRTMVTSPTFLRSLARSSIEIAETYAGFFEIDTDAFTYFVFCKYDPSAPVVLWLQGGPGASSLFGLFTEIGPIGVENGTVYARDYAWPFNLLFLDNPLGTGFSYTTRADRMATNETTIGRDLAEAARQFFLLFPEYSGNDFYVAAESYGGKYAPTCAYHLLGQLPNLKGISIGDGAFDPRHQFEGFGQLAYALSMADADERRVYEAYEARWLAAMDSGDYVTAFYIFDELLNGDYYEYGTYYANTSGLGSNYFNFEQGPDSNLSDYAFVDWLATDAGRDAMNVGDVPYSVENSTVETYLIPDWMRGVTEYLVPLLEDGNLRVLIYSGQNDVILGPALTEHALRNLEWSGQRAYRRAAKHVWETPAQDDPVSGYVKVAGPLTYVVVRGAGHMVPTDQPSRALDMITRFVANTSFFFS